MCEKYLQENHPQNSGRYQKKPFFGVTTVSLSPKGKAWLEKATNTETCEPLVLEMSSELQSLEEVKSVVVTVQKNTVPMKK